MLTAIYIRVSTGGQAIDGYSLDSQEELCLKKAEELKINVSEINIYREEGVSGEELDRPELNMLRDEVLKGLVNRVICVHPDRLSRDLTDKLIICRELQKNEVELVFVDTEYKNTPEGQLFFNMQSSIAQYELALIKKRTTRGRLEAVRKEKKVMPMRVAPFGYDLINSNLVINEEEAFFVKQIYGWYVNDKLTLREIGERLYGYGVLPKRKESNNWSASSLRRILTSPIYIGKYYYNKRKTKKVKGERTSTGNPRKEYMYRNSDDWILIDVPKIVEESLYEAAQEQKEKNKKKSGNQKFNYLLKSILRCGNCGRVYQATSYNGRLDKNTGEKKKYPVYRCPNLFPKKYGKNVEKCKSRSIRADLLEEYIWGIILKIINSPSEIIAEYKDKSLGSIEDVEKTLILMRKNLDNKKKERERVKQMFVKGYIEEEEMSQEIVKLNNEMKKLNDDCNGYKRYIEDYKSHLNDERKFKEILASVLELLENNSSLLSFSEKRFILENLIDEIVIRFEDDLETVNVSIFGAAQDINPNDILNLESCSQHQEV